MSCAYQNKIKYCRFGASLSYFLATWVLDGNSPQIYIDLDRSEYEYYEFNENCRAATAPLWL